MSIKGAYRGMPDWFAVSLAILMSCVLALTIAVFGASALCLLLDKFRQPGDLGNAILAFFYVAPGVALLALVFCFAALVNWRSTTTWWIHTFAFVLGAISIWVWSHDRLGIAPFVPGAVAWSAVCWFAFKKTGAHSQHVV
jgi:hypothetical protein